MVEPQKIMIKIIKIEKKWVNLVLSILSEKKKNSILVFVRWLLSFLSTIDFGPQSLVMEKVSRLNWGRSGCGSFAQGNSDTLK